MQRLISSLAPFPLVAYSSSRAIVLSTSSADFEVGYLARFPQPMLLEGGRSRSECAILSLPLNPQTYSLFWPSTTAKKEPFADSRYPPYEVPQSSRKPSGAIEGRTLPDLMRPRPQRQQLAGPIVVSASLNRDTTGNQPLERSSTAHEVMGVQAAHVEVDTGTSNLADSSCSTIRAMGSAVDLRTNAGTPPVAPFPRSRGPSNRAARRKPPGLRPYFHAGPCSCW